MSDLRLIRSGDSLQTTGPAHSSRAGVAFLERLRLEHTTNAPTRPADKPAVARPTPGEDAPPKTPIRRSA